MKTGRKEIFVNNPDLDGLFKGKETVIVPEYQRPFEWGQSKAKDLLDDLTEFFLTVHDTGKDYYLGTILFYYDPERNTYEIIDGQQRITTLLILKQMILGELPDNQNIAYGSYQSIACIKEVADYFKANLTLVGQLSERKFLKRLQFTQVITYSQDDSFAFFDTQNNRGVSLAATDFLKAYHLREIVSISLQEQCASKWEKTGSRHGNSHFLTFLFDKILYRARGWKGKAINFEKKELILKMFQKATIKNEEGSQYPLYHNVNNMRSIKRGYDANGSLVSQPSLQDDDSILLLPFSLRQPLHKGLNFFHFTEKYTETYSVIFEKTEHISDEVLRLRIFFNAIYSMDMSEYLRNFFQLCVIMYYDSFKEVNLLYIATKVDYLIGSIRIKKQQIKKEAVALCLTEPANNLLDVIANAYRSEEISDYIDQLPGVDDAYKGKEWGIVLDEGVRGRYKRRVLKYFNKTSAEFKNRKTWVNEA